MACALADAGVQAGQPVGVMLPNGVDLIAALFGVWRADAVYVPLNPRLTGPEIDRILAKVASRRHRDDAGPGQPLHGHPRPRARPVLAAGRTV